MADSLLVPDLRHTTAPSEQAKPQRNRDQDQDACHFAAPFNRKALATTMTEEPDMASAAINGVTIPMIAIGTAMRL